MDSKRTVLPLLGTAFLPGQAIAVIEKTGSQALTEIAQAEVYYFSAHTKECVGIARKYLQSEDVLLRLSADLLYTFGSLTLGNSKDAQAARQDIYDCTRKAFEDHWEPEMQAQCLFALYAIRILFHIPPKFDFPPMANYLQYLPEGQRLFTMHMMAHSAYLQKEYSKSQGILEAAWAMSDRIYPIPLIYMRCLEAACLMNQKKRDAAYESIMQALKIAKKDQFWEPFIEYHGLLQGVLEVCIKQRAPDSYKKMIEQTAVFGNGWRQIHNPEANRAVTDLLTPVEFSIAMLACRDWTNQEIAEHMRLSVNTVKHYISTILEKLQIEKRVQIQEYVNQ